MDNSPHISLVLGGARSGKSAFALDLARQKGEPVLFVATAVPLDAEMQARVDAHRAERPSIWRTVEEPLHVAAAIRFGSSGMKTVLVDCLSMLTANHLIELTGPGPDADDLEQSADARSLVASLDATLDLEIRSMVTVAREAALNLILVSGEVGLGIVPPYFSGRVYRDVLGRANQIMASFADTVYLMIAGLAVDLRSISAREQRWPPKNWE